MVCVAVVVFVCGLFERVCVLACGLLCDIVWYAVCAVLCVLFFFPCVFVWFVCDRVSDGVWLVVVDCLCAGGLKLSKCVCVFCMGFNL